MEEFFSTINILQRKAAAALEHCLALLCKSPYAKVGSYLERKKKVGRKSVMIWILLAFMAFHGP